jgi:hypothetical protein
VGRRVEFDRDVVGGVVYQDLRLDVFELQRLVFGLWFV